jgi:hypothetical protein
MRFHSFKKQLALYVIGLAFVLGCEKDMPDAPKADATPEKPSKVSFDDVKRDAARSITTTATYSQQERDSMIEDMKAKMATMDENIETLRLKGKDLAIDARANWDKSMVALDEKRRLAKERLDEIGESSSKAWSDLEKGAKAAWEDLSKAFQEASSEF